MQFKKLLMVLPLLACLTACGDTTISSDSINKDNTTEMIEIKGERSIEELKELYPDFFEIDGTPFKGVEVYVWQMSEDSYSCGLMFGTNRNKTDEEILNLHKKSLSINEAKLIFDEVDIEKSHIIVIPTTQTYSSYYYEIDDEYIEKVSKLFE